MQSPSVALLAAPLSTEQPPCALKSSFFRAHTRLYVAFYDERQTERMSRHSLNVKYIIVPMASALRDDGDIGKPECFTVPSSLVEIYKFNEITDQIARRNADHKLVFSAGCSVNGQIKVVFLVGCHLIMSRGLDADQTYDIFSSFEELFVHLGCNQVNILDCWRALHRSTCLGWIDFRGCINTCTEGEEDETINMEEFMHYSRSMAYVNLFLFSARVWWHSQAVAET